MVSIMDIKIPAVAVHRDVVIPVARQPSKSRVLVEPISAGGIRDDPEELVASQVIDPWQRCAPPRFRSLFDGQVRERFVVFCQASSINYFALTESLPQLHHSTHYLRELCSEMSRGSFRLAISKAIFDLTESEHLLTEQRVC
jgi:hypothetical protein